MGADRGHSPDEGSACGISCFWSCAMILAFANLIVPVVGDEDPLFFLIFSGMLRGCLNVRGAGDLAVMGANFN